MAKNKQPPEERKPDLAEPDLEAAEQRVREMLEIDPDPKVDSDNLTAKKIEVKLHEPETEAASAPQLPDDTEQQEEKSAEEVKDTVDLEEEPEEKVLNLDEAPKDASMIEEIEPDFDSEANLEEPLLEEEKTEPKPEEAETGELEKTDIDEVIRDEKTEEAVDEIIAHEGDELLEAEDEKIAKAFEPEQHKTIGQKITSLIKAWWNNPKARWGTIAGLVIALVITFAVPASRYFVLNTVGFRAEVSVKILDESTSQPLKNVEVVIGSSSEKTDSDGLVKLQKVRLGSSKLVVKKRAFAESSQDVTVTFGNNSFGDVRLKPTGVQYSFVIHDYLSDKPVEKVEAISGEASAFSDSEGKIKLTLDSAADKDSVDVSFKKEDYREDKVTINLDDKSEQKVVVVPARRHLFVSKRTGKYDVYSINVDGKNEKQILAGTGIEKDDIALAINSNSSVGALVSTRDDKKNSEGFLLSTLTIIDDQTGKTATIDSSERIRMIDWVGDNLVYVKVISGASAGNPKRHRLISYNYKTAQSNELAASNYFNDVIVANDKVYYAPSGSFQPEMAKLYRVNADGAGKTTILDQEVWSIFRADQDNLVLSANLKWFNLRIGEDKATSLTTQPTNPKSRAYVRSSDNKNNLWVDERDGKGVLLNYETESRNELVLNTQSGLRSPVYWLNSRTVVFRIVNEQETADYVLSLDGGVAKKIGDVTNTNSIEQWYYY